MTDITALFNLDPLSLTKENIDEIVAEMRKARAAFQTGDKTAGSPKRKSTKGPDIDLDTLGILEPGQ